MQTASMALALTFSPLQEHSSFLVSENEGNISTMYQHNCVMKNVALWVMVVI